LAIRADVGFPAKRAPSSSAASPALTIRASSAPKPAKGSEFLLSPLFLWRARRAARDQRTLDAEPAGAGVAILDMREQRLGSGAGHAVGQPSRSRAFDRGPGTAEPGVSGPGRPATGNTPQVKSACGNGWQIL